MTSPITPSKRRPKVIQAGKVPPLKPAATQASAPVAVAGPRIIVEVRGLDDVWVYCSAPRAQVTVDHALSGALAREAEGLTQVY